MLYICTHTATVGAKGLMENKTKDSSIMIEITKHNTYIKQGVSAGTKTNRHHRDLVVPGTETYVA